VKRKKKENEGKRVLGMGEHTKKATKQKLPRLKAGKGVLEKTKRRGGMACKVRKKESGQEGEGGEKKNKRGVQ